MQAVSKDIKENPTVNPPDQQGAQSAQHCIILELSGVTFMDSVAMGTFKSVSGTEHTHTHTTRRSVDILPEINRNRLPVTDSH